MPEEDKIKTVIHDFFKSMDLQDFELMKRVTAQREEMVHIGTDSDEIWRGWDDLKEATHKQFQNLESYKATIHDLSIHLSDSGNVAWYSHFLDAEIKSTQNVQNWKGARFTGVLEKVNGQWKIVQTHVSIPEANQH